MKKKLLLTGASGFLGYHLMRVAAKDWEIYGLVNSGGFDFENAIPVKCDITSYIELGNFFDEIEPDAVIHVAAISSPDFCQLNKEISYSVNVAASQNLAGICSDFQIPLAFTSTDLVFDGKKGMYTEGDEKNPVNIYGEHKSIAEEEILKIYPPSGVFRIPLMFGTPEAGNNNFIQKITAQLKSQQQVPIFTDEFRSICGARSISMGLLRLFENYSGIIHLAGKDRLSRYDFGIKLADAFQLQKEFIQSCSQKDVKTSAPRAADVSLNISNAISLGYSPMSVDEELIQIYKKLYL